MWYRQHRTKDSGRRWEILCRFLFFTALFLLPLDDPAVILISGLFSAVMVGGIGIGVVWVRVWEVIEAKSEEFTEATMPEASYLVPEG